MLEWICDKLECRLVILRVGGYCWREHIAKLKTMCQCEFDTDACRLTVNKNYNRIY